jgi:oxygen-dependent protoporphyrinogen oxidase
VSLSTGKPILADHVVSAIPAPSLATISSKQTIFDPFKSIHAVTVGVVNVTFAVNEIPLDIKNSFLGFGMLSPLKKSSEIDPHLLGIIFDSSAIPRTNSGETSCIKLTVMMGGHYWDSTSVPSPEDVLHRSLHSLYRHFRIPREVQPCFTQVALHPSCIPQYYVGHGERLREIRRSKPSRLHLAGCWYDGVGVNDCVHSAWNAVQEIK